MIIQAKYLFTIFFTFLAIFNLHAQEGKYIFTFLNKRTDIPKLSPEESAKIMEGHMANINKMANENKLLAAGPFEGGGGIFIFNTTSIDSAQAWMSPDPGVQAKRWNIEMFPFIPREGCVTKVDSIQMVMYTFVKFTATISKFNAGTYVHSMQEHDRFVEKITSGFDIVSEGIFSGNEGGILILKKEIDPSIFEKDPAVLDGLLRFELKKLYVAKGAFCEK